jgi:hypothetical protein
MRRLALPLVALALLAPVASARIRTVHHPANACSFSLAPTWTTSTIPGTGITRATVLVYGQTQQCAQWAAYSPVDWITVEAAPQAAQPAAFVTVTENAGATSRSATLIIAGVRLLVTQDGSARIAPPIAGNLLVNGTFDRDIANWGWQPRFPNGLGVAQWSQFDGNGSPASGSILMRDDDFVASPSDLNYSFQRLQCVRIDGGAFYDYGAKVRTGSAGGEVAIAFITFTSTDCSDVESKNRWVREFTPAQPGVWEKFDFVDGASGSARSAIIVLASAADQPPFEVWFDDVYLRKK